MRNRPSSSKAETSARKTPTRSPSKASAGRITKPTTPAAKSSPPAADLGDRQRSQQELPRGRRDRQELDSIDQYQRVPDINRRISITPHFPTSVIMMMDPIRSANLNLLSDTPPARLSPLSELFAESLRRHRDQREREAAENASSEAPPEELPPQLPAAKTSIKRPASDSFLPHQSHKQSDQRPSYQRQYNLRARPLPKPLPTRAEPIPSCPLPDDPRLSEWLTIRRNRRIFERDFPRYNRSLHSTERREQRYPDLDYTPLELSDSSVTSGYTTSESDLEIPDYSIDIFGLRVFLPET